LVDATSERKVVTCDDACDIVFCNCSICFCTCCSSARSTVRDRSSFRASDIVIASAATA
jgi:hypothetical protein